MFSSQMLQALLNERENDHPPGSASALGPTMPMRVGAALNPVLERVQDIFPKDNPYGSFIERLIVGDSPDRTRNMKEGIPHQYTGAGPNDPIIRPQIVDLAAALPIGSAATLAKAAVPFVKAAAVPAAMATGAGALNRLKAPGYAATSTDDIGAALLGQSLQTTGKLDDAMVAYQGSPHKFDALDPTKIGTGEGNQVFGHGAYVAQDPRVGGGYREDLSSHLPSKISGGGVDVEVPAWLREKIDANGIDAAVVEWTNRIDEMDAALANPDTMQPWIIEANRARMAAELDAMQKIKASGNVTSASPGYLYEIDVPDEDIAKMLDWDAPLSEQPELLKIASETYDDGYQDSVLNVLGNDAKGEDFYKQMGTTLRMPQAKVSPYLEELGIPGIKYYDQGSRGAEEGTRNMVLFDELARRAKVLKRNDEAIAQPSVDEFIGDLLDEGTSQTGIEAGGAVSARTAPTNSSANRLMLTKQNSGWYEGSIGNHAIDLDRNASPDRKEWVLKVDNEWEETFPTKRSAVEHIKKRYGQPANAKSAEPSVDEFVGKLLED
jgi:hypothetical protein